ncbi:MAG: response regulator [Lachnospiraceae bacterium]
MDIKDYEKILHAIPTTGVFIIREDNHKILYYNERVKEIVPHVYIGMTCHEMGNHSCANCPLLSIGDRQENRSLGYNSPFGEIVDIVAVRTRWEGSLPAYIITVTPHIQAITHSYHKIMRINLTRDRYEIVKMRTEDRAIGYGNDTFSSWMGQFIYDGGIHPDDMNNFISFTHLDHMKRALDAGKDMLTCCYRRRTGDEYRWNLIEVVPDSVTPDGDQHIFLYVKDVHDILQESLELDDASIRVQEVIRTLGEQNFGIYGIDLDTGEANLVRENGHTHTGWKSWTVQWDEIVESRLGRQLHPTDREKVCKKFSLEGLRQMRDSSAQKEDMLCQWRGEEEHEYRYMAVIAYFGENHGTKNYTILALQNVDRRVRQEHALTLRDMQLASILKSRYSVMTTVYLENGQCEQIRINEGSEMKEVFSGNYHRYFQKVLETSVSPEDAETFRRVMSPEHLYQKAAGTRDYYEEICQYRLVGPSLKWVEQHVIYARRGSRMSVNILGRDITREKLEEEFRLKEEQKQADIIRTLGGMFFATYYADLEEDTFRSVTELEEVGIVLEGTVTYDTGLKAYAEHFIHPDDREEYLRVLSSQNLRRTLCRKQPYVTLAYRKMPESKDVRPEEYGWIRGTAVMSQAGEDGKVRSIVYAAQDVTESKRKEMREQQALEAACEAADRANASKQEFLSCISHNVRTPMNGIMGMIKIATDHVDDQERVKDCLEKASFSSRQLLSVLNEILDISQIKSGNFDLKAEMINLPDLMQEVVAFILPDVKEKNLKLQYHPVKVLHENVQGDRLRLSQMFLNILSNSVKYTPSGGVIEVSVTEQESGEHGCSSYDFVFSDNGIGMEEEFIGHIFEPFSREKVSGESYMEGVGLGMSIAQNIARMMGGTIGVKSHPGQGSQFTVTVILRLQNPEGYPDSQTDKECEDITGSLFRDCKILLVEDNELNQEIAMEFIGEIGAMVECAEDGRKGLQRFAEMPEGYYDMILMDIQMPVMNGFEATRAIRKLPRADAATIPIIALSANVSAEDIVAGREAGMNGHLAKPLDIPQLMERMEFWLGSR